VDLEWEIFKKKGLNNIKSLNEHICYFIFSFFILSITLCFLIIFNGDIIFSNKLMINSKIANFLKQFLILISILILGFVSECVKKQKLDVKGYYILYLFIILSSLLILSVNDFLSAFLLIEMQGLLFSVLIAFRRNSPISIEAGIKYFIFSAVNSAVLLFFFR
jgi:NADH-quinone oxidoreductase subunit N